MEVGDKIIWPDFVIGEIVEIIGKYEDPDMGEGPWYKIVFEARPDNYPQIYNASLANGWYHESDLPPI